MNEKLEKLNRQKTAAEKKLIAAQRVVSRNFRKLVCSFWDE